MTQNVMALRCSWHSVFGQFKFITKVK